MDPLLREIQRLQTELGTRPFTDFAGTWHKPIARAWRRKPHAISRSASRRAVRGARWIGRKILMARPPRAETAGAPVSVKLTPREHVSTSSRRARSTKPSAEFVRDAALTAAHDVLDDPDDLPRHAEPDRANS